MKSRVILSLALFSLLLACQNGVSSSVETNKSQQAIVQKESPQVIETEEEEVWTPTAIEECMAKVKVGEPFKFETSFNPFYLRADLDGNKFFDYAVLIKGQNTNRRGVVICKDSKEPFVFGALSKPNMRLSSFDDDNFVTNKWEVSTKEYTRIKADPRGRRISSDAKGESITFVFEGGNGVNIYWDGKTFRLGE